MQKGVGIPHIVDINLLILQFCRISERKRKKLDRAQKRDERRKERRREREKKREKKRKNKKNWDVVKDCNSPSMKCFTHDDTHWRTPPLWNCEYAIMCCRLVFVVYVV